MEYKTFNDENDESVVRISDILDHHVISNTEHVVQEIHDILESYYRVAPKRLVDNICKQAVGYHLVKGPQSPLKLFSPSSVNELFAEQLKDLAGEMPDAKRTHKHLAKEIMNLEKGMKILI